MNFITESEARQLALHRIQESEEDVGMSMEIIDSSTVHLDIGWIYFHNTSEFLRTGNTSAALVGNCPLFVSLSGKIYELPTSKPWQESLTDLRDRGGEL